MAFYNKLCDVYYCAWRKIIRKLWSLPFKTHCRFLHVINDSLPIDIILEKRCLKFIWSCINSSNQTVKSLSLSNIKCGYSVFGENYRYLSYKYDIWPTMWYKPFYTISQKVNTFIKISHVYYYEAYMVRDLCIQIDTGQFDVSTSEEMCFLIEFLCTI